jgi:hypothetical protein
LNLFDKGRSGIIGLNMSERCERLSAGANRAEDESSLRANRTGEFGTAFIDLKDANTATLQAKSIRAESVGFHEVGPGVKILLMGGNHKGGRF